MEMGWDSHSPQTPDLGSHVLLVRTPRLWLADSQCVIYNLYVKQKADNSREQRVYYSICTASALFAFFCGFILFHLNASSAFFIYYFQNCINALLEVKSGCVKIKLKW